MQFGKFALPGFWHFEILAKTADLVALDAHIDAVGAFADGEVAQLPGKGVVYAIRAFVGFGLDVFKYR